MSKKRGREGEWSQAADAFGQPRPLRRGSLTERFVKCSKPGCACAVDEDARHGPYYSLTRAISGRTKTRLVNTEEAPVVSRQIEAGRRFRKEIEAYWQECERHADAELEALPGASVGGAKKRGSKRKSRRKSLRKSNG